MAEAIADMVIRIGTDVEALKRDMNEVSRTVKKTSEGITSSMSIASTAISTLAAGLSVGSLWNSFRAGVAEMAAFEDASVNAGTSVEKLGQLVADLAPQGVGLSQISTMIQSMNRSLLGAEGPTSRAGAAFKALGIQTKDNNGNLKDGADLLREVAVELDKYADGTNKVQMLTALMNRNGGQYTATMKALATSQGNLNRMTADGVAQADLLDDRLTELNYQWNQFRNSIMLNAVPPINAFITAANLAAGASENWLNRLRMLAMPKAFREATEKELARLQGERETIIATGITEDIDRPPGQYISPAETAFNREYLDRLENRIAHAKELLGITRKIQEVYNPPPVTPPPPKPPAPSVPQGVASAAAEARAAERERTQAELAEAANYRKAALRAEKEAIDKVSLAVTTGVMTERQAAEERRSIRRVSLAEQITASNAEIEIMEKSKTASKDISAIQDAKAARDLLIASLVKETEYRTELLVLQQRQFDAERRASDAMFAAQRSAATSIEEGNRALEDETAAKRQSIITGEDYVVTLQRIKVARMEAAFAVSASGDLDLQERLLNAERQRLALMTDRSSLERDQAREKTDEKAIQDKIQKDLEASERRSEQWSQTIEQSLTDALLRGFESGKSAAENFRETLKNMFLTLVLRPMIEPIMKPVAERAGGFIEQLISMGINAVAGAVTGGSGGSWGQWGTNSMPSGPVLDAMPNEFEAETARLARTAPGRRAGGPVKADEHYVVGEDGPEILRMGSKDGWVEPTVVKAAEAPALREAPMTREALAPMDAPGAQEAPALREAPVIREAPALREAPMMQETPALREPDAPLFDRERKSVSRFARDGMNVGNTDDRDKPRARPGFRWDRPIAVLEAEEPALRTAPGRMAGGPTYPDEQYVVGEEGPEVLRMGSKQGWVQPTSARDPAGSAGRQKAAPVVNISQTFNVSSGVDAATAKGIWFAAKESAKSEIADHIARGGKGYA